MGQFDQTARPLVKLDGARFIAFALSCIPDAPRLTCEGWDDTRRLAVPGEPDRTNDLLAEVRDEARPGLPAWLIIEIEDEAEGRSLWRAARYEIALGSEVNPACDPDGPAALCLLVNLSGTQRHPRYDCPVGGAGHGLRIGPLVVNFAEQDALTTLERIGRGEVGLTLLPFLALMKGGGDPAFITRWKSAAEKEPDVGRRIVYRDSAHILSELTKWQVNWLQQTEGWMARESTLIKGWLKEGREEGELLRQRATLLKAIRRHQDPVPEALRLAIEGTNDIATLERWFDAALVAASLADLRREMKVEP